MLGGEGCDPEEVAAAEKRFEEQFGLSIPPALGKCGSGGEGVGLQIKLCMCFDAHAYHLNLDRIACHIS